MNRIIHGGRPARCVRSGRVVHIGRAGVDQDRALPIRGGRVTGCRGGGDGGRERPAGIAIRPRENTRGQGRADRAGGDLDDVAGCAIAPGDVGERGRGDVRRERREVHCPDFARNAEADERPIVVETKSRVRLKCSALRVEREVRGCGLNDIRLQGSKIGVMAENSTTQPWPSRSR